MRKISINFKENNNLTIQNDLEVQSGIFPTLFEEQPTVNNTSQEEPAEKLQLNDLGN